MANHVKTAHLDIIEGGQVVRWIDYEVKHDPVNKPTYYVICDLCNEPRGTTVNGSLVSFKRNLDMSSDDSVPVSWLWEDGYIPREDSAGALQKNYTLRVPTTSLELLVHDLVPSVRYSTPDNLILSRSFSHSDLLDVLDIATDALNPTSDTFWEAVANLPVITSKRFPYHDEAGDEFLLMENSESTPLPTKQKLDAKAKVPCKLCGLSVALNAMRNHVGRHIFLHQRGIVDQSMVRFQQYIGDNPCGWCGLDGCSTVLYKKGKKRTTVSNCPYHYERMSFASAQVSSASSPSTNVPIHCILCSPKPSSIWKYNILAHLIAEHAFLKPTESGVHLPSLPDAMWLDMYISYFEESAMVKKTSHEGISRIAVNQRRDSMFAPHSDMIVEIQELEASRAALRGRKRAFTGETTASNRREYTRVR